MSCTTTQIDHLNNNTTPPVHPGHSIYDAARQKIYFVYCNNSAATAYALENYALYFREWDIATKTFAGAVGIEVPGDTKRVDRPSIVMLDDGTLVVCYMGWNLTGSGLYETWSRESTDFGATWTSRKAVDTAVASRQFVDMGSDGTNVIAFTVDEGTFAGSPPGKSLWAFYRTGVGTWGAAKQVFVGATNNEVLRATEGSRHTVWVKDANTQYILMDKATSGTPTQAIMCYRTTDAGATWSEITVRDFGTNIGYHFPRVFVGTDGKHRATWRINDGGTSYGWPELGMSEDEGLTWSTIGTPEITKWADTDAWREQNIGFVLGKSDLWWLTTWVLGTGNWTVYVYKGTDDLSSWQLVHNCDVVGLSMNNLLGDLLFADNDLYVMLDPIVGSAFHIALLFETLDTGGGDEIPTTPESKASGAEESNIYARIDLFNGSGWSLHYHPVGCWMSWDMGDAETGSEVPEVISGSPSIDPTVQAVDILPALWRVEAPGTYGKRSYTHNGTDLIVYQDPLKFRVTTKDYLIDKPFTKNVARGVMVTWTRDGSDVTMQVLVEGKLCKVVTLSDTGGESRSKFFPLPRSANVGERIQFVVEDETVQPFAIDAIGWMFIPKGIRGRN